MFVGRFLVRYDPYGLFRRDLAPRLSWPRAIRWCRLFFFKNIVAMPRRLLYPPPSVDLCAPYGPIMCFREWGKTGRHDPSGMSGGALARRARSVDESCASSQCKLQRRRYRQPHPDFTSLKEPVRPQPSQRSSTDLPNIRWSRCHDRFVDVSGDAKVPPVAIG